MSHKGTTTFVVLSTFNLLGFASPSPRVLRAKGFVSVPTAGYLPVLDLS